MLIEMKNIWFICPNETGIENERLLFSKCKKYTDNLNIKDILNIHTPKKYNYY